MKSPSSSIDKVNQLTINEFINSNEPSINNPTIKWGKAKRGMRPKGNEKQKAILNIVAELWLELEENDGIKVLQMESYRRGAHNAAFIDRAPYPPSGLSQPIWSTDGFRPLWPDTRQQGLKTTMCLGTSLSEEEKKQERERETLPGRDVTADWLQDLRKTKTKKQQLWVSARDEDTERWWWSWWRGFPILSLTTHVVSQTVGLIGYGQSGELPQSQLALHGLVCAHDEGLARSGRERQRLNWEDRLKDRWI